MFGNTMLSMSRIIVAAFICPLLIILGGCKKSAETRSASQIQPTVSRPGKQPVGPKLDACRLLTKEEIQAVQESAVTDTKSSEGAGGVFRMAQCYFAAAEA